MAPSRAFLMLEECGCWVAQGRLESAFLPRCCLEKKYTTLKVVYIGWILKSPPTQYLKLVTTRTMIFWVTKSQNETFTWHCRVLMGEDPIHIGDDFVWKQNGATLKFGVLTSQKSLNLTTMLTHPKPQSPRKNLVEPVLWGCRIGCCSTFSLVFSAADDFQDPLQVDLKFYHEPPWKFKRGYTPEKIGLNGPKWKASLNEPSFFRGKLAVQLRGVYLRSWIALEATCASIEC